MLTIGSYNIRKETPEDINDLWVTRKNNVMKLITDYNFDILGLQEVRDSQWQDLREMEDFSLVGEGRSVDETNENNPIMYKHSKILLIETDTFWLSETCSFETGEKRWNAACPRICTWAKFKVKETEEEFVVINTHFDHMSEEARYQSALLLSTFIEEHFEHLPCLLLGDFNGEHTERFYQVFKEVLHDAISESSHHAGPKVTCTGVTFNHELSWEEYQNIDYIFINKHCKINKTVVITDRFNQKYPSDHFPILIKVSFC